MSYEDENKKTTVLSDTKTPVLLSCVMVPKSTQGLIIEMASSGLRMLSDITKEVAPAVAYSVLVDRKAIPYPETFREFMFVDLFMSYLISHDLDIIDVFSRNLMSPEDAIQELRERGFKI